MSNQDKLHLQECVRMAYVRQEVTLIQLSRPSLGHRKM